MPTYMLLMQATEEGSRRISDVNGRYDAFKKELKKSGGRLIGAWALLGEADYCAMVELPSEKDVLRLSLGIGKRGASKVHTYRAFPMEEFAEVARDV